MDDYRVIIVGSRSFSNYELLKEHCLFLLQKKMRTHRVIIASGHAHGADTLGEQFAKEQGLTVEFHPDKWSPTLISNPILIWGQYHLPRISLYSKHFSCKDLIYNGLHELCRFQHAIRLHRESLYLH